MYKQEHVTAVCIGFENVGKSGDVGGIMMLLKEAVPFLRAKGTMGQRPASFQVCRRFFTCERNAAELKTIFTFEGDQSKNIVGGCREGAHGEM